MLSKVKVAEEHLQYVFLQESSIEEERFAERQASLKESLKDINFWQFLSVNYLRLNRFFTLLDVESGPESGWEKFAELLGLVLWEDRKWCYQYHGGLGPTRASLARLVDRGLHDKDLTLASVAELIEEMGRFDILRQIDWELLIENFKGKSQFFFETGKDAAKTFSLEFQRNAKCNDHLVKSECLPSIKYDLGERIKKNNVCLKNQRKSQKDFCILFSYAFDAEVFAEKVANSLRSGGKGQMRIRVLMIGESRTRRALASDYNNILHKWFHQVRYVVPILSPEYLRQIQNLSLPEGEQDDGFVASLNRLIYRLSLDQFVSLGSRNLRCRPVCPKEFACSVKGNLCARANGLLSPTWSCETPQEINDFRMVLCDEPLL